MPPYLYFMLTTDDPTRGLRKPLEREVRREYAAILELPAATPKGELRVTNKPEARTISVARRYVTAASVESILAHYGSELVRQGWSPAGMEGEQRLWGSDDGSRGYVFCKNGLKASVWINHATRARTSHQYELSMSWAGWTLRRCKPDAATVRSGR